MATSKTKRLATLGLATLLVASNCLFGFPIDQMIDAWNDSKIVDNLYHSQSNRPTAQKFVGRAKAANFSMQTGYYVGNGSSQAISGLGFQPQFVIIKSDTAAGSAVFKTSAMPAANIGFFSGTADLTSTLIALNSDGFTVGNNANVNSANVRYVWTAFTGSDCTSTGTICIGSYTGDGTNPRKITTGFQPSLALVKRSNTTAANFRTASMPTNTGDYFTTTAENTTGGMFTSFATDGFNVGSAVNNVSAGVYYYIAFKAVSGVMAEGTYSGNATDNRSITGFGAGYTPNLVFVKNANNATASNRTTFMLNTAGYGDSSSRIDGAAANSVNIIQKLQSDGFQVGTGAQSNASGSTIYWAAFGGAAAPPAGTGTFDMAVGTYTGTGSSLNITGLSFKPDLVIIKDTGTNYSVFRTSLMAADNTAYLANAAANFTGGVTSLNNDGFTVGTSTATNTTSNTYHWQAFGNAYNPITMTGASDFAVGAYTGNGIDSRDVNGLPFQPDFVAAKRNSTTAGVWRSSALSGDLSSFFTATAEGANRIQALNSDGFQLGTNTSVNASGTLHHWFGFKSGSNFVTGSYTGNGTGQTINIGFRPDLVWTKRSTAVNGVYRASSQSGDSSQYFMNLANVTGRITDFVSNGFTLGTQTEANTSAGVYRYAAWRAPSTGSLTADIVDGSGASVASPSVDFASINTSLACQANSGTFGTASQKLRVNNSTTNGYWTLAIAATGGSTASWSNGTNSYDFNDSNGAPAGCSDGGDTDSLAGQLSIDPSAGTLTPQASCSSSGITKGSASAFNQGIVDSITLLSAAGSQTNCYYDLTGVSLSQQLPAETPANAAPYTINLTITVTAS